MTQIKKPKGDFLDDVYTLLHPMRFWIVKLLAEKPMNITEISKAMGEDGRPVATNYNLNILEEYGFVSSKYEISEAKKSKGRALRIYKVTDKVDAVLSEFKKR